MNLLLVGASGLVGRHVLDLALADDRIGSVVAPVRRGLPHRPKLFAPIVDFERLPDDAPWWRTGAVICMLGTTMRAAGSQGAFRKVDYEYPLAVARLAKRNGAATFVLNSAMAADPSSRFFYNRVKGEAERDLATLGFRSLTIVRPGLIGGQRDEVRRREQVASLVLGRLSPLLPRRMRINPAARIAQVMVDAATSPRAGVHLIGSAELT